MAAVKPRIRYAASFVTIVGGNDTTWRSSWPAQAVGGRVLEIPMKEIEQTLTYPNTDSVLPWQFRAVEENGKGTLIRSKSGWERYAKHRPRLTSLLAEFPSLGGEPVVFARPCRAREALARAMRNQGIRTLAETDDNYFASPDLNIFSREQEEYEKKQALHSVAMASMHGVVFSTEWLRDRYVKEFRRRFQIKGVPERKWMPELFVCRNHMPSWAWPTREEYDGPLRFGWMGSPSHVWDVGALAYASFHAAKALGCRTFFIGYNPADPDPDVPDEITVDGEKVLTRTEESIAISRRWASVVDEHIRWIPPEKFKRGGLPLDIAIAPLLRDDFNAGRSDIKCIEGTVAGAAMVCSNYQVFRKGGWKHKVNCLMGASQEELAMQVVRLIKEPNLRAELVAAATEMVRSERNEQVMAAEWGAALSS